MKKYTLTESKLRNIIREAVSDMLTEINLGNGQIDLSDWHITDMRANDDGYYEFEVRCDNDWYTLRGSYFGNGVIELDELISGHSGHGRQVPITSEVERWFDTYCADEVVKKLELWIEHNYVKEPNYDEEY